MIDEAPYTFPDPEILRSTHTDPVRIRQTPDIEGATSAVAGRVPVYHPPESPSQSRKQLSVFKEKKILFSRDLNVNEHLAKTLQSIVEQAGGEMTASVDDCDIYIGHYRDGMDYIAASQDEKVVANLAWFYNVINRNRWTNPASKLLHYPVPREGIPGFKGLRISLSNYTGEARIYLENLIKESGAEFTKTMKQDNTHLITAHKQSEKCDAAEEWNIHTINHLWLEESYAKCAIQTTTYQRYTHFPSRTNLSEIVGQTTINMEAVRKLYFANKEKTIKDVENGALPTNGLTPHPYRGAVNPQRSPRKTLPPIPVAESAPSAPVSSRDASAQPVDDDDTPAPQTARKPKVGKVTEAETPSSKYSDGKENATPSTTGRASKNRALNALHAAKDDIALYEKEMKRKGGVIHGGRRVSDHDPPASAKKGTRGRKRKSEDGVDADGDSEMGNDEEDDAPPKATARQSKKAKKAARENSIDHLPPVKYRMLVTGDNRWYGKAAQEEADTVSTVPLP